VTVPDASRFDGQTAIVTGASRGIGLAVAQRLVDRGANVVITGRKQPALDEAIASLAGDGKVLAVAGHAADADHQDEVIARALDAFGGVHLLVNNTGVNPAYGGLLTLPDDAARKIVEVNNLGALSWVRKAHAAWMGEHGGSVVNIASVAGLRAAAGIGFYGASKAMLIHLTMQLAVELAPTVRVNAVAPAVVKTRFAQALYEEREAEVAAAYPLKRLGTPEDVAGAVAFLLSDEAAWITGQTLVLDGGLTLAGGV